MDAESGAAEKPAASVGNGTAASQNGSQVARQPSDAKPTTLGNMKTILASYAVNGSVDM